MVGGLGVVEVGLLGGRCYVVSSIWWGVAWSIHAPL